MLAVQIAPGLWRWTAPHPEWTAGAAPGSSAYWDRDVGSVMYELDDAVALIDPLLPVEGREEFVRLLDERGAGRPVSVLTTTHWHRRDREELAQRYQGRSARAWNAVPAGVSPRPLRGAGETMFWLPRAAALVCGDRLIGDARDGLAVCPESWLADVRVDRAGVAGLMRGLLELPVERVLVSHGEPVLHDGRAVLARAIARASEG